MPCLVKDSPRKFKQHFVGKTKFFFIMSAVSFQLDILGRANNQRSTQTGLLWVEELEHNCSEINQDKRAHTAKTQTTNSSFYVKQTSYTLFFILPQS